MTDLIKIKPTIDSSFRCLFCHSYEVEVKDLLFQGMHILADCRCGACTKEFYHTLPVGHDALFPVSFAKEGNLSSFDKNTGSWLAEPLLDSVFKFPKKEAETDKKTFQIKETVVILNCLDSCFGHVLSRLWNAKLLMESNPEKALIILLPKAMEWLVPTGVAEIWTVGGPLSRLKFCISNIDPFIKEEIKRFREVYLSTAPIYLDSRLVNLEAYFKTKEFSLTTFSSSTPQISFILRNDRFWHGNRLEFLLYKACIKYNLLRYAGKYFNRKQNRLINKVAQYVHGQIQEVKFYAIGIGEKGGLNSLIQDSRTEEMTDATEQEWCKLYAKSHIVIGVHGSGMLIPTSLAAGFIELLPRHKIPHITEDLAHQQPSRYSIFLGRHLDHFAPAKLVSLHAVSMIRDFPFLFTNTEKNS